MHKARLSKEKQKEAKELARKYANLIIEESLKENKNTVRELLDNLAGLVAFLQEFLLNPQTLPSKRRHITRALMEEILERTPMKREEQILFILSAIQVYTNALFFLENDIFPFTARQ